MAKGPKDVAVTFDSSSTTIIRLEGDQSASSQTSQQQQQKQKSWLKKTYHKLSPSRQIFCLFCIFDFLFTFFLWIIYAQGVSVTGLDDSLSTEIGHYGITSSLFDIALMAFMRVSILLVVYGYYISTKVYAVLLTTAGSTIYLIVKAIVFKFDDTTKANGNRPVDYFLHVGSFILCWVEIWYLNVKVLPREKKIRLHNKPVTGYGATQGENGASSAYSVLSFHTPPDEDSEDEETLYRANLHYIETARETTNKSLKFLYAENQWNVEKQKTDLLIESMHDENLGKVMRLRVVINASTSTVYTMVFGEVENYLKWNDAVTQIEVIFKVNSTTDITYSSVAEIAGGLFSARDYVNIRHFQRIGSMFLITSTATTTDLKPHVEGIIRGESLLNCYALSPAQDDPGKSEFVWIASTSFKPSSMPQGLIDRTMPGYMCECAQKLKKCCEEMQNNTDSPAQAQETLP